MVASNRDIKNINFYSSALTNFLTQIVFFFLGVAMNVDKYSIDNYDNMRKRKSSPSNISSRNVSVISNVSSVVYYDRMIINNDLFKQEQVEPIDNFQVLYSRKC